MRAVRAVRIALHMDVVFHGANSSARASRRRRPSVGFVCQSSQSCAILRKKPHGLKSGRNAKLTVWPWPVISAPSSK